MNVEERIRQLELELTRTKVEQASLEAFLIKQGIVKIEELTEYHRQSYQEAVGMKAVLPHEIPEMFR